MFERANPFKNTDPTGHLMQGNAFQRSIDTYKQGNPEPLNKMLDDINEAWNAQITSMDDLKDTDKMKIIVIRELYEALPGKGLYSVVKWASHEGLNSPMISKEQANKERIDAWKGGASFLWDVAFIGSSKEERGDGILGKIYDAHEIFTRYLDTQDMYKRLFGEPSLPNIAPAPKSSSGGGNYYKKPKSTVGCYCALDGHEVCP